MNAFETIEHNNHIIQIFSDDDPLNPREEYDHNTIMICSHPRYILGDEQGDHEYAINTILDYFPKERDQYERAEEMLQDIDNWSYLEWRYSDEEQFKYLMNKYPELKQEHDVLIQEFISEHGMHPEKAPGIYHELLDMKYDKAIILGRILKQSYGTLKVKLENLKIQGVAKYNARYHRVEKIRDKILEGVLDRIPVRELFLYDHSGITMSTGRFSCPWDSGQVGIAFIPPEIFKANFDNDMEKGLKAIDQEVEEYDQYLTGDVWGYVTSTVDEDGDPDEEVDSCWGFYGFDYCVEEAKANCPELEVA